MHNLLLICKLGLEDLLMGCDNLTVEHLLYVLCLSGFSLRVGLRTPFYSTLVAFK